MQPELSTRWPLTSSLNANRWPNRACIRQPRYPLFPSHVLEEVRYIAANVCLSKQAPGTINWEAASLAVSMRLRACVELSTEPGSAAAALAGLRVIVSVAQLCQLVSALLCQLESLEPCSSLKSQWRGSSYRWPHQQGATMNMRLWSL